MARLNKKRPGNPRYAIVVDGYTEKWYLQLMKEYEKYPIDIEPKLPKKKTLKEQYEFVLEQANLGHDKVYWIVDLDTVIKEHNEKRKNERSVLEDFKDYLSKINSKPNIKVLVNNPCLELWFLLHFKQTSKYYPNCDDVIDEIHNIKGFDDYEKSEKYFKKHSNNLYIKLKQHQQAAIKNAMQLGTFDPATLTAAKAEMHEIVSDLLATINP